jgi:hypothetical protein
MTVGATPAAHYQPRPARESGVAVFGNGCDFRLIGPLHPVETGGEGGVGLAVLAMRSAL